MKINKTKEKDVFWDRLYKALTFSLYKSIYKLKENTSVPVEILIMHMNKLLLKKKYKLFDT